MKIFGFMIRHDEYPWYVCLHATIYLSHQPFATRNNIYFTIYYFKCHTILFTIIIILNIPYWNFRSPLLLLPLLIMYYIETRYLNLLHCHTTGSTGYLGRVGIALRKIFVVKHSQIYSHKERLHMWTFCSKRMLNISLNISHHPLPNRFSFSSQCARTSVLVFLTCYHGGRS